METNKNDGTDKAAHEKVFKKHLDTDFPLSGGEEDLTFSLGKEETEEERIEREKQEKAFKKRLDTEFPLSGGETDGDL